MLQQMWSDPKYCTLTLEARIWWVFLKKLCTFWVSQWLSFRFSLYHIWHHMIIIFYFYNNSKMPLCLVSFNPKSNHMFNDLVLNGIFFTCQLYWKLWSLNNTVILLVFIIKSIDQLMIPCIRLLRSSTVIVLQQWALLNILNILQLLDFYDFIPNEKQQQ